MSVIAFKLASDAHAMAVKFGALLVKGEKLCADGSTVSGPELTKLAAQINRLSGMLNSLYYTAQVTLTSEDFDEFCRLSKIEITLIQEGVQEATEEFTNCHYELSEN